MKLEKLSALAELVSSVAIVLTLGYLAVQTRQNTLAIQATVRQAMLTEDRELLFKQMEYPFVSLRYPTEELTVEQQIQLDSWTLVFFRARENHWLQYQNGVIDEATWVAYRQPLYNLLAREYYRALWREYSERGDFDLGFVEQVNGFLRESSLPGRN